MKIVLRNSKLNSRLRFVSIAGCECDCVVSESIPHSREFGMPLAYCGKQKTRPRPKLIAGTRPITRRMRRESYQDWCLGEQCFGLAERCLSRTDWLSFFSIFHVVWWCPSAARELVHHSGKLALQHRFPMARYSFTLTDRFIYCTVGMVTTSYPLISYHFAGDIFYS